MAQFCIVSLEQTRQIVDKIGNKGQRLSDTNAELFISQNIYTTSQQTSYRHIHTHKRIENHINPPITLPRKTKNCGEEEEKGTNESRDTKNHNRE